MSAVSVGRALKGVLAFQLVIGGALVLGDMSKSGFRLPGFGPGTPALTEPVRPGDQRRTFDPGRVNPNLNPVRDPGALPDRLALTQIESDTWRLEGGIEPGDAERIRNRLAEVLPTPRTLVLQSPGGSVRDALDLGRHLRAEGIATEMLAGEYCYSACPYLFAGGAERTLEDGASLGVHQHYFGQSTLLPAFVAVEDIQRGQGEVMTYLDDMGIDPLVMQHALSTPPDEIYVLLPEEIARYRFETE
ncbi:COG3904 family protein [Roseivivax sp. CAU 1753]